MNELANAPFIIGVMVVAGLGIGYLTYKLTSGMSCGAKRKPLPEPKSYPAMPPVTPHHDAVTKDYVDRNVVFRNTTPPAPPIRSREAMRQPATPTNRYGYADPDYVVRDDLATSMLVAQATDNALLGYAAGGSVAGALLGAAIAESERRDPVPEPTYTPREEVTYTAPAPTYSRCNDTPSYSPSSYDSSSYSDSSSPSCGD